MSAHPRAPPQPDLFSPLAPSLAPSSTSLDMQAPAWVSVGPRREQQRSLETVTERSEGGLTRSSGHTTSDDPHANQGHAMPFSLPATPPHSPQPLAARSVSVRFDGSNPRARRPAHLNLLETPPRKPHPGFSLSAATPTFNPVVGGSSTSGTPTRPSPSRVGSLKADKLDFSSLPSTPLRSLDRFSAAAASTLLPSPLADSHDLGTSNWTWPPRSANLEGSTRELYGEASEVGRDGTGFVKQSTPTKASSHGHDKGALASSPPQQTTSESTELVTRYVLVEGLDKQSTEDDLRSLVINRCRGLSLRGCFTSALRTRGIVILVFADARHAVAAARALPLPAPHNLDSPDGKLQWLLDARCVTRDVLEELHTGPDPCPLLSRSEAVLVFTLRGPTSTPYFTPLPLLASFGEIRSLKVVEEHLHVVEYWDDRSAQTAYGVLDGRETGGVRFGCSFEPDVASTNLPAPPAAHDPISPIAPVSPPAQISVSPAATAFSPTSTISGAHYLTHTPPHSPVFTPFSPKPVAATFPQPLASRNAAYIPSAPPGGTSSSTRPSLQLFGAQVGGRTRLPWEDATPEASPIAANPYTQLHSPAIIHSTPVSPMSPPVFASTAAAFGTASHSPSPRSSTFPPGAKGKTRHRSRLSEDFGIVRDDKIPASNVLNFERIENGLDMRTTLMLKNIPNKLKDWEVMEFVEKVVGRAFDFFYLRCDYSNDCNVGYGFVNFTSTTALLAFAKARLGTRWNMCGSDKLCIMSFANIQGKASLINHFKNSSVLDQEENRRPKLFVTSGPNAGQPEPFPTCDDPIRKARSAMNAQSVGLFPSHKPVFKVAQAFKGLHI
ncbi:hypothetical protein JCM10207_008703 [Rhodosporidiobolus poonsookiae]